MKKYRNLIFLGLMLLLAVFFVRVNDTTTISAETSTHTVTFNFNTGRISKYLPSTEQGLINSLQTYTVQVADGGYAEENKEHYGIGLYYKYNWTVDGKIVNLSTYPITKDTTFVATWKPIEYTVTFQFNSAQVKNEITNLETYLDFTIESDRIDFYIPNRPNYVFNGWYMAGDFTTWLYLPAGSVGDKYLTARFTPIEYEINYNTDLAGVLTARTYNVEDPNITLVDATKKGHIFKGWYADSSFKTKITEIECRHGGNISIYPKWELEVYTVKYIMPDGTIQYVETEYGKTAEKPEVEKSIFEIITTDVSRKNITEDTTINVKIVNILLH